jgi:RNA polymerase sigma factor (sigma-70 family)
MSQQLFNPAVHKKAYSLVKVYVISNSGTADDVQEILQEGWYIIFKKAHANELDIGCQITAYLFGICKNLWRKELQNRKAQILCDAYKDIEDTFNSIAEEEEEKEVLLRILLRNLKKLSEKCQEVFRMKMEGYSCEEMAVQLELDSSQISRNKIFSCKKRLQTLVYQDPEYIRVFGNR